MSKEEYTVWHAFYDLLRGYGVNKIFGNPGSTEQPMLKNFPSDFDYVLGLQEASVVAMAGGFAEATRKVAVVSLHTSAGTGNGMGSIMTANLQKIPLVIIAGQQTREMLVGEPLLANRDSTLLPRPHVKWSYEPPRAVDVPAALVRAIAAALQPPAGPVYLSIPLDDWDVPYDLPLHTRSVSTRYGPDPDRIRYFTDRIVDSSKIALVLGPEIDKSLAWKSAVDLSELLEADVFSAPLCERAVFPETHSRFCGPLFPARGPLAQRLSGYDLVLVVGAEVFRYYPWVAGPVLPPGTHLLQITNDPNDAAKALVGDSMLSDVALALDELHSCLRKSDKFANVSRNTSVQKSEHVIPTKEAGEPDLSVPMSALNAFTAVAQIRPKDAILVHESPSNTAELIATWKTVIPESLFTFASGGLGWNCPAAVGIALAQQISSSGRLTVCVIGDGSFQYSVQSIYTAVQRKLRLIILVPINEEYAVLKAFGLLENTPNVPGLDIPGLKIVDTAKAFGMTAFRAETTSELQQLFKTAMQAEGPTLIEFPISRELRPLTAQKHAR